MRSVIDARHRRALNAINVAITFAAFTAVTLIAQAFVAPADAVVPIFVVSLYLLGALTVIEVWRITRPEAGMVTLDEAAQALGEEAAEPML